MFDLTKEEEKVAPLLDVGPTYQGISVAISDDNKRGVIFSHGERQSVIDGLPGHCDDAGHYRVAHYVSEGDNSIRLDHFLCSRWR